MGVQAVVYLEAEAAERAAGLAERLALPSIDGSEFAGANAKALRRFLRGRVGEDALVLLFSEGVLRLQSTDGEWLCGQVDFTAAGADYRRRHGGGRSQMIAKAAGLRPGVFPHVLDATAGLGGDAFVLACLGCELTLAERVPEVHALLDDGLRRARLAEDVGLAGVIGRMRLVPGDAVEVMAGLPQEAAPDVVYLDPMFPERAKSALVKKEMRLFHRLVGKDADAAEVLDRALECARYRVVVKRPRLAERLAGPEPNHVFEGKRNRYDVYAKARLPAGLSRA
ncbi:MAG: class I SAM-dependent methyltransferase [Verrucomicrobiota bacterium]